MPTQSGNQTTTSTTKLPEWYDQGAQAALQQAQAAAAAIAKPYMQNTVANIDPLTGGAITKIGQNAGSTNAGYNVALQGTAGAMNYDPSMVYGGSFLQGPGVGAYMNPYIQNVEQSALGNQQRAYQQNLNAIGDQSINAGAFGGSRHGVAEGVAAAENARQMGDLSGQLRSQGYAQASQMMGEDLNRNFQAQQANQQAGLQGAQLNLQAANQYGQLTGQKQDDYLQGMQAAINAGNIRSDHQQALLNQKEDQYNAMSDIPANQLNLMLAALSGMQVPTSTKTRVPTSGSWLTGALGAGLSALPYVGGLFNQNNQSIY